MNLDNKLLYIRERDRLRESPLNELKKLVAELHDKRYLQGNGDVVEHHRLATYVLNQRTQLGAPLKFHLKEIVY